MSSGFAPPVPGPDSSECVFYHDFEALTANNLWRDKSRNGLHATPINYVAPSYGLARSAKGKGYAALNGTNQSAVLSTRFYDVAPTTQATFVLAAYHRAPAISDNIFNCRDVVALRGLQFRMATTERLQLVGQDLGGVFVQLQESTDAPYTGRLRVSIVSASFPLNTIQVWNDGGGKAAAVVVGAIAALGYNTAHVPTIGAYTGGSLYFDGNLYFLALFRDWIPNDREAKALSQYLRDWV